MPQNLKVTRTADFTGAAVVGLNNGLGLMGKGRVFYVDGTSGADGYGVQSQNPNYPMETITGAMDLCTSAVGDVIVSMANSPSSPPDNETFPIAMDVQGVMLTGLYSRGLLSDSGIGSDESNVACIEVGAHYTGIENMYLGIIPAGSSGGVIEFNGTNSYFGCYLRNSMIEAQYTATYGVYMPYDQPYYLIEGCKFGRSHLTNFTNCVYIGNCCGGMIRYNWFTGASSYCISVGAGCGELVVTNNHFQVSADTDGFAIMCASGSSNNYFAGNMAAHGDDDPTNELFADYNNSDNNDWGWNTEGDDVAYPGTS